MQEINKSRQIAGQQLHLENKLVQQASSASTETDSAVYYKRAAECKEIAIAHNGKAVELIKKLNKKTHDDKNTIDLHRMQVTEAMECLGTFLDSHLFEWQSTTKPFRMLNIVTGWGRHRHDGNSQIRLNAIELFKSRILTWRQSNNPGILNVWIQNV